MTEEAAHSPLGPSSAKRWINCGGSVLATKDIPDVDKEYALEGTAAHTISEIARIENKPMKHYLGQTVKVPRLDGGISEFLVNQEMVDAVQVFIDHCELLPGDAFFEVRLRYDKWVKDGFGTADDIRIDEHECNITDLKYGKGEEVEAEDNEQLKMYALGVLHDYGYLYDIKVFHLHIAQPRIGPIKSFTISTEDLLKWADEVVVPAAKRAMKKGAPFAAGSWCKWCRIKEECKVRANTMAREMLDGFEEIDTTDVSKKANQVFKPQDTLTNDQFAQLMHIVPQAKAWLNDIEAYVMRALQNGTRIGDWKLVQGRSNRAWFLPVDDMEMALLSVQDAEGKAVLEDKDIFKKKLKGPAQVEKILGKKHPFMRAFDAEEDPGFVRKPPGKPKLAPGSDKRPAMTKDALDDFHELTDNQDNEDDEEQNDE